jgi:hypothetical protein
MAVHWQFIEDQEHRAIYWTWRTMRGDRTIETQSPRFKSYGATVADAIRHGFQPRRQHWIVITAHGITHFRPGEPAMTLSTTTEMAAQTIGWLQSRRKQNSQLPAHLERRKKVRQ